jgi:hypothetical protein
VQVVELADVRKSFGSNPIPKARLSTNPGHRLWGTQIRQDGRLAIPDVAKAIRFGRSVGSDTNREPLAANTPTGRDAELDPG